MAEGFDITEQRRAQVDILKCNTIMCAGFNSPMGCEAIGFHPASEGRMGVGITLLDAAVSLAFCAILWKQSHIDSWYKTSECG